MIQKLKTIVRSPWAWFGFLVVVGTTLSFTSRAASEKTLRSPQHPQYVSGCIVIAERGADGSLTGRVGCATPQQVQSFCRDAVAGR